MYLNIKFMKEYSLNDYLYLSGKKRNFAENDLSCCLN